MAEAEVHIVEYDEDWPRRFVAEREQLRQAIGDFVVGTIEHVGSTAVPGLAAKPIIDIMVGVAGLTEAKPAIPLLEAMGYCYFPHRPDVMHWLCKPSPMHRTHHVHLVPFESRLWVLRLKFRDRLRSDADVAADYARLKRSLAARYPFDREAYTEAKGPFIRRILGLPAKAS